MGRGSGLSGAGRARREGWGPGLVPPSDFRDDNRVDALHLPPPATYLRPPSDFVLSREAYFESVLTELDFSFGRADHSFPARIKWCRNWKEARRRLLRSRSRLDSRVRFQPIFVRLL